jgi:UDP-N-acetylglucosamine 4-epimerase
MSESAYDQVQAALRSAPKRWLLTGVAGFIGSHLLETLLKLEQQVIGLDNFSTGYRKNLEEVQAQVTKSQWKRFLLVKGDITEFELCCRACKAVDYILHQAALASVPRSIADPLQYHTSNTTGFLNILVAARDAKVKQFVYASSSAVFGDDPQLPKVEEKIGTPLSPYAATKLINELYAGLFGLVYGLNTVGLRYFNVFGPRQDPGGAYAAVIPTWIAALLKHEAVYINGDGETTRDFCYVDNVVQANLLAATVSAPEALNQVYNIALGERTTLNQLFEVLQKILLQHVKAASDSKPVYREFRKGDIPHSIADISKAKRLLGFAPTRQLAEGLEVAMDWYLLDIEKVSRRDKRGKPKSEGLKQSKYRSRH